MIPRGVSGSGVGAPVGVADFETARVLVWREGFGWVDRPEPEVEADDAECEGAA